MNNVNVSKIRKDIEDLKSKKAALEMALQKDVTAVNEKITLKFREIGEKAYVLNLSGTDSMAELSEDFFTTTGFKAEIEALEKKIAGISERYNEEIEILEKLMPPPPTPGSKGFCVSCGKEYAKGVDMFCIGCGSKHN